MQRNPVMTTQLTSMMMTARERFTTCERYSEKHDYFKKLERIKQVQIYVVKK